MTRLFTLLLKGGVVRDADRCSLELSVRLLLVGLGAVLVAAVLSVL